LKNAEGRLTSRNGEENREEVRREPHSSVDESRPEVDVRIESSRDKVVCRRAKDEN